MWLSAELKQCWKGVSKPLGLPGQLPPRPSLLIMELCLGEGTLPSPHYTAVCGQHLESVGRKAGLISCPASVAADLLTTYMLSFHN